MKKLIIFVLFIFITGCSVDYNLEVSNNSFKEKIDVVIDKSENSQSVGDSSVELDDQLTPFIEEPINAFFTPNKENYKKKVKEFDNYYKISLSYNFNFSEFKKSNSLNSCFENVEIKEEDNKYYIHAYGAFYCLYEDVFNIKLKTKNNVINHNANSVNDNLYVWNIDNQNVNNVDVKIEINKGLPYKRLIINISILISVVLIIGFIIYYLFLSNKENNKI